MSIRFLSTAATVAAALASAASIAGCGASDATSAGGGGGGAGAGLGGATGAGAMVIAFSEASVVFVPGKTYTLKVQVTPPGAYTAHLALLGDALDAYLDRSQVVTSANGSGSFSLTAPSSPTTFSIRASVGSVTAEIGALPGTDSTTMLRLVPVYSGHRKVVAWVGTVSAGGSCDPSSSIPPVDGPLAASAPDAPVVESVPLGTPLAVTVRAGHFAGGCIELPHVVEAEAGTAGSVLVPATDRPLSMGDVRIAMRLGIDTTSTWIAGWTALSDQMATGFSPDGGTDVGALLDAMHDATPVASQGAFATARTTNAWDATLGLSLHDALAGHALRATVKRWIGAALPRLATDAIVGTLVSSGTAPYGGSLEVTSVGGVAPATAGFPSTIPDVSWTAAPDDHVLFGGGAKSFSPSALAAALALAPAEQDAPTAKTVPEALAAVLSCTDVATLLVGSRGTAHPGCDATCVTKRCQSALTTMWARASGAVAAGGQLDLSASAAVSAVSDTAAPVMLDGTWVGDVHLGAAAIHVGGPALGGPRAPSKP